MELPVLDCARRQSGSESEGHWQRAVGARCLLGPRWSGARSICRGGVPDHQQRWECSEDERSHPSRSVLASTKQARCATTSVCWTTKHCLVRAAMRVIATLLPAVREVLKRLLLTRPVAVSWQGSRPTAASSLLTFAKPQRSLIEQEINRMTLSMTGKALFI